MSPVVASSAVPEAGTATIEPAAGVHGAAWHRTLLVALAAYILSRACVAAGAAATVTAKAIDPLDLTKPDRDRHRRHHRCADELGRPAVPAHRSPRVSLIQPDVTFGVLDARAAFFPLYPLIVRGADRALPGGDVFAALFVNLVMGAAAVYVIGLLAYGCSTCRPPAPR